jgi:hypothetical protein
MRHAVNVGWEVWWCLKYKVVSTADHKARLYIKGDRDCPFCLQMFYNALIQVLSYALCCAVSQASDSGQNWE